MLSSFPTWGFKADATTSRTSPTRRLHVLRRVEANHYLSGRTLFNISLSQDDKPTSESSKQSMSAFSISLPHPFRLGNPLRRWQQKLVKSCPSLNRLSQHSSLLLILFALLVLLSHINIHPDPPLRLSGIPISKLIPRPGEQRPEAYFGITTRFLLFNSWYGQFNNQILALINAISIARNTDAVLVLPCEKLGKESSRDSRFIKMRRLFSTREIVGDYFNYSLLASAVHAVRPSQFLASVDGKEILNRRHIVVERKSGSYYRFLLNGKPHGLDQGETGVRVLNPDSTRPKLQNWCDFRASQCLTHMQKLHRRDRFVFLPVQFRHHSANCSKEDPRWVTIRRYLQPRHEFQHPVDAFLTTVERPIFAVHLRFFLNGDLGQFTPQSVVKMLYERFRVQLEVSKTIFIAYTPSSAESFQIVELLRSQFHGQVVGGETIVNYLEPEAEYVTQLPLSNVLLDMWVCVKSDFFLGRMGSSMSWNIVYWRQALSEDYGLHPKHVLPPLWYALTDFTTTAATRVEG